MTNIRSTLLAGLVLATTLGACSAASAPSPSPATPSSPAATRPPPTQVPGGTEPSNPGNGGVVDPAPGGGGGGAPGGQPEFVVPKPGTLDQRPVSVETLEARIDGRKVVIVATWWSGVEPCSTLDTVTAKRDGNGFTIDLIEGSAARGMACIMIAVQKATAIDLGELEPGEYTVAAQGSTAKQITFTVA